MKKIIFTMFLLFLIASAAFAFDGYVTIYNRTGYDIYFLNVKHKNASDWEEDVLGDDILAAGDEITVDLYDYKTPIIDVMAEDEEGDIYYFWNLDVEYNNLSITVDYISY